MTDLEKAAMAQAEAQAKAEANALAEAKAKAALEAKLKAEVQTQAEAEAKAKAAAVELYPAGTVFVCFEECFTNGIRWHAGQTQAGTACPPHFKVKPKGKEQKK
jgi:hypothetical protein